MLFINYKGDTPQQRFYTIGIQGNNKANKIVFAIAKKQADLDLSSFNAYLKVENKEGDYKDKIELNPVFKYDEIHLTWEMTRKSTAYRNLALQVVFENNDEDIVWQTLMCEIELNSTIKVDEEISDKYPTILQQLQKEVNSIKADKEVLKNIKYDYDEEHNQSLLVFPKGVLPTMFEDRPNGETFYFDYDNESVVDYDNNQIGNLHIWDSVVSVWLNYQIDYEPNPDDFIVEYMSFDGNFARINTYNLYNETNPNEVLLHTTFEYVDGETKITFPMYVAPLVFYSYHTDTNYYLDYSTNSVYDEDKNDVGYIERDGFGGNVIQLYLYETITKYDYDDDTTFIHFNNYIGINGYDLYHPSQGDDDIVSLIGYSFDNGYLASITFPKGIIPITANTENHSIDFDYSSDGIYEPNLDETIGLIEKDNDANTIKVYDMTDYEIIPDTERIVSLTYLKTQGIANFKMDFTQLNSGKHFLSTQGLFNSDRVAFKRIKLADQKSSTSNYTTQTTNFLGGVEQFDHTNLQNKPQNTIFNLLGYLIEQGHGGVFSRNNMTTANFQTILQTYTYFDYDTIAFYQLYSTAGMFFIPFDALRDNSSDGMNALITAFNNNGGFATRVSGDNYYIQMPMLFRKTNDNHSTDMTIQPFPLECLCVKGLFKHEIWFDNQGKEKITMIINKPRPFLSSVELHNYIYVAMSSITDYFKCVSYSESGNGFEIDVLKIESDNVNITCKGIDVELTNATDTFSIGDFSKDIVKQLS